MTRNRLRLGLLALVLLGATAGCSSILGPGEPDPEQINRNATYDWDTEANVTIDVNDTRYTAIYEVQNRSELELYGRDALGTENPLEIQAVQFRYTNGTVTNVSAESVELTRDRAIVTLPARYGHLAVRSPRNGKRFSIPVFIEGSYDVTLPDRARVAVPILSRVHPGGFRTSRGEDGRVTIHWDSVETRSISMRWYLARDLWIFGGLLTIAVLLGGGGAVYYLRQIRALERRREEVGLDVDTEDDDPTDRGPPPGT